VRLWCADAIGGRVAAFPERAKRAATSTNRGNGTLAIAPLRRIAPVAERAISSLSAMFRACAQERKIDCMKQLEAVTDLT
jgi:hypothetical protein